MSAGQLIRFPVERTQPRRLVSLRELQERYSVSERTLRYRIASGMPVHRYGRRLLRFDVAETDAWMEGK